VERAKAACFRLLGYRARSEAELRERLTRRKFELQTIERALSDLRSSGLVNDREFAESWIKGRREVHFTGRNGLRWELRRKGVPEAIIQAVLDTVSDEEELELAMSYVQRKLSGETVTSLQGSARLRRALVSRGFSGDIIQAVLERFSSEE